MCRLASCSSSWGVLELTTGPDQVAQQRQHTCFTTLHGRWTGCWMIQDPETVNPGPQVDYTVDARSSEVFYKAIRTYWPGLPDGALEASFAGIRPKASLLLLLLSCSAALPA